MSLSVLPMLSSKSFIVSGLTFRYIIHSEFIFVCSVKNFAIHSFMHNWPIFPAPLEETVFSLLYIFASFSKIRAHRHMDLSLGFLFCSMGLYLEAQSLNLMLMPLLYSSNKMKHKLLWMEFRTAFEVLVPKIVQFGTERVLLGRKTWSTLKNWTIKNIEIVTYVWVQ